MDRRHDCTTSAIAAIAVVASLTALAVDRLALVKSTAIAAAAAIGTRRLIARISVCHAGWQAAIATATAARAVKIQTFETECSAAATAACCPSYKQQALRLLPWPYEDSGFNNAAKPHLLHTSILLQMPTPTGPNQLESRQRLASHTRMGSGVAAVGTQNIANGLYRRPVKFVIRLGRARVRCGQGAAATEYRTDRGTRPTRPGAAMAS